MKILEIQITIDELKTMANNVFGDLVKAVVDVEQGLVAVDAELHADLESLLLENGAQQKNLWGINFYPELQGEGFVEFDAMINIRPSQENMSRSIDDQTICQKIIEIVNNWVKK